MVRATSWTGGSVSLPVAEGTPVIAESLSALETELAGMDGRMQETMGRADEEGVLRLLARRSVLPTLICSQRRAHLAEVLVQMDADRDSLAAAITSTAADVKERELEARTAQVRLSAARAWLVECDLNLGLSVERSRSVRRQMEALTPAAVVKEFTIKPGEPVEGWKA